MSWAVDEWKDGLPSRALQRIGQMEAQLERIKKEKEQKQCQLDSLEQALQGQKRKTEEEKAQISGLKRENQTLSQSSDEVERKRQKLALDLQAKENQISCLTGQLSSLRQNLDAETVKVSSVKAELEKAQMDLCESEKHSEKLSAEHHKQSEYISHQRSQIDSQTERIHSLENEIKRVQGDLSKVASVNGNMSSTGAIIPDSFPISPSTDMLKAKVQELEKLRDSQQEEIAQLQQRLNNLEKQIPANPATGCLLDMNRSSPILAKPAPVLAIVQPDSMPSIPVIPVKAAVPATNRTPGHTATAADSGGSAAGQSDPSMQKLVDKMKHENDALKNGTANLELQVQKKVQEINAVKEEMKELQRELGDATKALGEKERKIDQLQDELRKNRELIEQTKNKLSETEERHKRQHQDVVNTYKRDLDEVNKQIQESNKTLETLRKSYDQKEKEVNCLRHEKDDVNVKLQNKQRSLEDKEKDNSDMKTELNTLRVDLERSENQKKEENRRIQDTMQKTQSELADALKDVDRKRHDIEKLQERLASLTSQHGQSQTQLEEKDALLSANDKQIGELKAELLQVTNSLNVKVHELHEENDRVRKQNEDALVAKSDELHNKTEEIHRLNNELLTIHDRICELENSAIVLSSDASTQKERAERLELECKELQEATSRAEREADDIQAQRGRDVENLNNKLGALHDTLAEKTCELEGFQNKLDRLQESNAMELEKLTLKFDEATQKFEQQSNVLNEKSAEMTIICEQNGQLTREFSELQDTLNASKTETTRLNALLNEQLEQINTSKAAMSTLKETVVQRSAELQNMHKEIDELQTLQTKRLDELLGEKQELLQKLEHTEVQLHEKESQLSDFTKKLETVEHDLPVLQEAIDVSKREIDQLNSQVLELTGKHQSGQSLIARLQDDIATRSTQFEQVNQQMDEMQQDHHVKLESVETANKGLCESLENLQKLQTEERLQLDNMKEEMTMLQETLTACEAQYSTEKSQMEIQIKERDEKNKKLESLLNPKDEEIVQLNNVLAEMQSKVDKMTTNLDMIQMDLEEGEENVDELSKKNEALEGQLEQRKTLIAQKDADLDELRKNEQVLATKLQESNDEIQILTTDLMNSKTQVANLQQSCHEKDSSICDLAEYKATAEISLQTLETDLVNRDAEITTFNSLIEELESAQKCSETCMASVKEDLAEKVRQITELECQLDETCTKNTAYKEQLEKDKQELCEKLKNQDITLRENELHCAGMEEKLKESETQLHTVSVTLEDTDSNVESLTMELKELTDQRQESENNMQALRKDLDSKTMETQALQKSLDDVNTIVQESTKFYDREKQDFIEKIDNQTHLLDERSAEIEHLHEQMTHVEADCASLHGAIEQEKKSLKEKTDMLDNYAVERDSVAEKIKQLEGETSIAENKLQTMQTELDKLQHVNTEKDVEIQELNMKSIDLRHQLQTSIDANNTLRDAGNGKSLEIEQLQITIDHLNSEMMQLKELESEEKLKMSEKLENQQCLINEKDIQLENLSLKVSALQDELQQLQLGSQQKDSEIQALNTTVGVLTIQLEESRNSLSTHQEELDKKSTEINNLHNELDILQGIRDTLADHAEASKQETILNQQNQQCLLDAKIAHADQINCDNIKLNQANNDLCKENIELQEKLCALEKRQELEKYQISDLKDRLEHRLEGVSVDAQSLMSQIDEASIQLQTKEEELQYVQEHLKMKEATLEKADQNLSRLYEQLMSAQGNSQQLEEERIKLLDQITQLNDQLTSLIDDNEDADGKHRNLWQQLDEAKDRIKTQDVLVADLNSRLSVASQELEKIQEQCSALHEVKLGLESRNTALAEQLTAINNLMSEKCICIQSLEDVIKDHEVKIEMLNTEIKEKFGKETVHRQAQDNELYNAELNLRSASENCDILQQVLIEKESEIQSLNNDIISLSSEHEDREKILREELSCFKIEKDQLNKQIKDESFERIELNSLFEQRQSVVLALKHTITELEQQVLNQESNIETTEQRTRGSVDNLQTEVTELRQQLSVRESRLIEVEQLLESEQSKLSHVEVVLEQQHIEAQRELTACGEKLMLAESNLIDRDAAIEKLNAQLGVLTDAMEMEISEQKTVIQNNRQEMQDMIVNQRNEIISLEKCLSDSEDVYSQQHEEQLKNTTLMEQEVERLKMSLITLQNSSDQSKIDKEQEKLVLESEIALIKVNLEKKSGIVEGINKELTLQKEKLDMKDVEMLSLKQQWEAENEKAILEERQINHEAFEEFKKDVYLKSKTSENKIEDLMLAKSEIDSQVQELLNETAELKAALEQRDSLIAVFEEQKERALSLEDELVSIKTQMADTLACAEQSKLSSQHDSAAYESELSQTKSDLLLQTNNVKELKQLLEVAHDTLNTAETEILSFKEKIKFVSESEILLKNENMKFSEEFEAMKARYGKREDELEHKIQDLHESNVSVEKQLAQIVSEKLEMSTTLEEKQDKIDELNAGIQEVDSVKEELDKLKEQLRDALLSRDHVQSERHHDALAFQGELDSIRQQLDVKNSVCEEIEKEVETLKEKLESSETKITSEILLRQKESEAIMQQAKNRISEEMEAVKLECYLIQERLERRIEEIMAEKQAVEIQVQDLKNASLEMMSSLEEKNSQISVLHEEINKVQTAQVDLERLNEHLCKSLTSAETEKAGQQQELVQLKCKIDEVTNKLEKEMINKDLIAEELNAKCECLEGAENVIIDLNKQIEQQTVKISDLSEMLESMTADHAKEQSLIEELEEKVYMLSDEICSTQSAFQATQSYSQDINSQCKQMESEQRELKEQVQNLKQEKSDLEEKLSAAALQLRDVEEQQMNEVKVLKDEGNRLEQELQAAQHELEDKDMDMEMIVMTKLDTEEKLKEVEYEVKQLKANVQAFAQEKDNLLKERDMLQEDLSKISASFEALNAENTGYKNRITAQEKDEERFKEEMLSLKQENSDHTVTIDNMKDFMESLESEVALFESEKEECTKRKVEVEGRLKDAEEQLQQQLEMRHYLDDEIQNLEKEKVRLQEQMDSAEYELQQVKSELTTITTSMDSRDSEINALRHAQDEMTQEKEALNSDKMLLETELKLANDRIQMLEKDVSQMKDDFDEGYMTIVSLEADLEKMRNEENEAILSLKQKFYVLEQEQLQERKSNIDQIALLQKKLDDSSAELQQQIMMLSEEKLLSEEQAKSLKAECIELDTQIKCQEDKLLSTNAELKKMLDDDKGLKGDIEAFSTDKLQLEIEVKRQCEKLETSEIMREKLKEERDEASLKIASLENDLSLLQNSTKETISDLQTKLTSLKQEMKNETRMRMTEIATLNKQVKSLSMEKCDLTKKLKNFHLDFKSEINQNNFNISTLENKVQVVNKEREKLQNELTQLQDDIKKGKRAGEAKDQQLMNLISAAQEKATEIMELRNKISAAESRSTKLDAELIEVKCKVESQEAEILVLQEKKQVLSASDQRLKDELDTLRGRLEATVLEISEHKEQEKTLAASEKLLRGELQEHKSLVISLEHRNEQLLADKKALEAEKSAILTRELAELNNKLSAFEVERVNLLNKLQHFEADESIPKSQGLQVRVSELDKQLKAKSDEVEALLEERSKLNLKCQNTASKYEALQKSHQCLKNILKHKEESLACSMRKDNSILRNQETTDSSMSSPGLGLSAHVSATESLSSGRHDMVVEQTRNRQCKLANLIDLDTSVPTVKVNLSIVSPLSKTTPGKRTTPNRRRLTTRNRNKMSPVSDSSLVVERVTPVKIQSPHSSACKVMNDMKQSDTDEPLIVPQSSANKSELQRLVGGLEQSQQNQVTSAVELRKSKRKSVVPDECTAVKKSRLNPDEAVQTNSSANNLQSRRLSVKGSTGLPMSNLPRTTRAMGAKLPRPTHTTQLPKSLTSSKPITSTSATITPVVVHNDESEPIVKFPRPSSIRQPAQVQTRSNSMMPTRLPGKSDLSASSSSKPLNTITNSPKKATAASDPSRIVKPAVSSLAQRSLSLRKSPKPSASRVGRLVGQKEGDPECKQQ